MRMLLGARKFDGKLWVPASEAKALLVKLDEAERLLRGVQSNLMADPNPPPRGKDRIADLCADIRAFLGATDSDAQS